MDQLLTLDEVAGQLRVSPETVRKLCVVGKLPWVNVGTGESRHCRRVLASTLSAYMRDERRAAVGQDVRNIKQTFAAMKIAEERW
jgi:excisionase family DNA binding protein